VTGEFGVNRSEIRNDGWSTYNIWEHSASVCDLYRRRARDEEEEMTCAAQAAELLAAEAAEGDMLLDVGCGTGYFFHTLRRRGMPLVYHGVDATELFIRIGREELARFGLPADRLQCLRIEDMAGTVDHVLCMNVLSNIDNYHRPLERLLRMARKSIVLRESIKDGASYDYVRDDYLDEGVNLRVSVNSYDRRELFDFIGSYGFSVFEVTDHRTGGKPESVIGYPHHWTFVVARR
jgi:SAM-dependent methyltransferase